MLFTDDSKIFCVPALGCNINLKSIMYLVLHVLKSSSECGMWTGKGKLGIFVCPSFGRDRTKFPPSCSYGAVL